MGHTWGMFGSPVPEILLQLALAMAKAAGILDGNRDKVFPALSKVVEGEVPVDYYQSEDMVIIGTPDECLRKILRYESVGVDQLLCYVQFGDLPHDAVMRDLELLAKEVMPKLEERGHRVTDTAAI